MTILALETSTENLSVALLIEERIVLRHCLAGQKHSELLLPMVEEILAEAEINRNQIQAVAFAAGPGSFTGLRIGCGVAQGIAYGLSVPVIAVPTLEAVAEASGKSKIFVALDARMGEIYYAGYERDDNVWKVLIDSGLCKPEEIPSLPGQDWFAAGNGFAVYQEKLTAFYTSQFIGIDTQVGPRADAVAKLAWQRYRQGAVISPAEAAPVYVRNKVALMVHEQRKVKGQ